MLIEIQLTYFSVFSFLLPLYIVALVHRENVLHKLNRKLNNKKGHNHETYIIYYLLSVDSGSPGRLATGSGNNGEFPK